MKQQRCDERRRSLTPHQAPIGISPKGGGGHHGVHPTLLRGETWLRARGSVRLDVGERRRGRWGEQGGTVGRNEGSLGPRNSCSGDGGRRYALAREGRVVQGPNETPKRHQSTHRATPPSPAKPTQ